MNVSQADIDNAIDRFRAKVKSGYYKPDSKGRVKRSDGSYTTERNYLESTLAEKFAADLLGCNFNNEVYESGGDGGLDFVIATTKGDKEVEVIWMGFRKGTEEIREEGHLIVNPYQPTRWSDIYVMISGSINSGFKFLGWTTHAKLRQKPKKDFGYGEKYAMHSNDLFNYDQLLPFLKK
tara:strand:+ start:2108 stop:2644 length:537 start_codon:yes stop_codon:yes gene_type:complete